jgi:hypothetical protein
MDTPWSRANSQRKSERQEQRIAAKPGGKKQVNSGRHWPYKRDNRLNGFLVEARTTDAGSYRISKEEYEKLINDAILTPPGLLPGMAVDLGGLELFIIRQDDHDYREKLIGDLIDEVKTLKEKGGS